MSSTLNDLQLYQTNLTIDKERLREFINMNNNEQPTDNSSNVSLVILVQVHKRIKYLEKLIKSLNLLQTQQNKLFLVIFSHDYFDVDMNSLIHSEAKFLFKQIFYPYMLQLYENKFPGHDPNDCPKATKKHDALRMHCNNAANPDSYGNYREFSIVQIKHHWFWKLSFVFESYAFTKFNKDLGVLLLEEDYYLIPDALHILEKLKLR